MKKFALLLLSTMSPMILIASKADQNALTKQDGSGSSTNWPEKIGAEQWQAIVQNPIVLYQMQKAELEASAHADTPLTSFNNDEELEQVAHDRLLGDLLKIHDLEELAIAAGLEHQKTNDSEEIQTFLRQRLTYKDELEHDIQELNDSFENRKK